MNQLLQGLRIRPTYLPEKHLWDKEYIKKKLNI